MYCDDRHLIFFAEIVAKQTSAVLILVAIYTEVFPVGPICRIVPMVSVFVVDGQEMPVLIFELPSALCADKIVHFKRLFPVTVLRAAGLFQLPHNIFFRFPAVII